MGEVVRGDAYDAKLRLVPLDGTERFHFTEDFLGGATDSPSFWIAEAMPTSSRLQSIVHP